MSQLTESGARAVGSPMSDARISEEANHAFDNGLGLLGMTDEGRTLEARFRDLQPQWTGWTVEVYKKKLGDYLLLQISRIHPRSPLFRRPDR